MNTSSYNTLIGIGAGAPTYTSNSGQATITAEQVYLRWDNPEDGSAGVREPRRPLAPADSGSIALEVPV